MHKSAYEGMKALLAEAGSGKVLEVGSRVVRGKDGSLRDLVSDYVGTDMVPGIGVDVVCGEYSLPFDDETFDIVMSANTWEHCRNPFRLCAEMARVLKTGGKMLVCAPFEWKVHRHPIDCFRFLPDGMESIMRESGLEAVSVLLDRDCFGVGYK